MHPPNLVLSRESHIHPGTAAAITFPIASHAAEKVVVVLDFWGRSGSPLR
jgi:hypothetical protein